MKIGIIVATKLERDAFYEIFGEPNISQIGKNVFEVSAWWFGINRQIHLITSGIGEISAAMSTQYLIDRFGVDLVINYGVVGGLSEKHPAKKVGIVTQVIHYDFDISPGSHYLIGEYPGEGRFIEPRKSNFSESLISGIKSVSPGANIFYGPEDSIKPEVESFVCASADKIVPGGEPKHRLKDEFDADICEMEAAGIVRTCNRNEIPCILIKAVSDGVNEDKEAFEEHAYEASKSCVRLIKKLIKGVKA